MFVKKKMKMYNRFLHFLAGLNLRHFLQTVRRLERNRLTNFNNNTYNVDLNVQKFDDFGESVNYGIVTDKQIDSVIVKTGRTNISDVNTIDRYDISEFTIKLFS